MLWTGSFKVHSSLPLEEPFTLIVVAIALPGIKDPAAANEETKLELDKIPFCSQNDRKTTFEGTYS